PHRVIDPGGPVGEACPQKIRRVHGCVGRQSRNHIPPGKRVSQQSVQQNQWRSGSRAQVTHARAIEVHPALFHSLIQSRGEACRKLLDFIHFKLSRLRDNSWLSTGVYLSERLCCFTLGSFGSPFLAVSGLEGRIPPSTLRAFCATAV